MPTSPSSITSSPTPVFGNPPTSSWGTSSPQYGQVSPTGQVELTPQQISSNQPSIPSSYNGTSSARYGQVSPSGQIEIPTQDNFRGSIPTQSINRQEIPQQQIQQSYIKPPENYWGTSSAQYGEITPQGYIGNQNNDHNTFFGDSLAYEKNKQLEINEFNTRLQALQNKPLNQTTDEYKKLERMREEIISDFDTRQGSYKVNDGSKYLVSLDTNNPTRTGLLNFNGSMTEIAFVPKFDMNKINIDSQDAGNGFFGNNNYVNRWWDYYFGKAKNTDEQITKPSIDLFPEANKQTSDINPTYLSKQEQPKNLSTPDIGSFGNFLNTVKGTAVGIVKPYTTLATKAGILPKYEDPVIPVKLPTEQEMFYAKGNTLQNELTGLKKGNQDLSIQQQNLMNNPDKLRYDQLDLQTKDLSNNYKKYWGTSSNLGEFDKEGNLIVIGPNMPVADQQKFIELYQQKNDLAVKLKPQFDTLFEQAQQQKNANFEFTQKASRYEDVAGLATSSNKALFERDPLNQWRDTLTDIGKSKDNTFLDKVGGGFLAVTVPGLAGYSRSFATAISSPVYEYGKIRDRGYDPLTSVASAPISAAMKDPEVLQGYLNIGLTGVGIGLAGAGVSSSGSAIKSLATATGANLGFSAGVTGYDYFTTPIQDRNLWVSGYRGAETFGAGLGLIGTSFAGALAKSSGKAAYDTIQLRKELIDNFKQGKFSEISYGSPGEEMKYPSISGAREQAIRSDKSIFVSDTSKGRVTIEIPKTQVRATGETRTAISLSDVGKEGQLINTETPETMLVGRNKIDTTGYRYKITDYSGNEIQGWKPLGSLQGVEKGLTEVGGKYSTPGNINDNPLNVNIQRLKSVGYYLNKNPKTGKYYLVQTKEGTSAYGQKISTEQLLPDNQFSAVGQDIYGSPAFSPDNMIQGRSVGIASEPIEISAKQFEGLQNTIMDDRALSKLLRGPADINAFETEFGSNIKNPIIKTTSQNVETSSLKPSEPVVESLRNEKIFTGGTTSEDVTKQFLIGEVQPSKLPGNLGPGGYDLKISKNGDFSYVSPEVNKNIGMLLRSKGAKNSLSISLSKSISSYSPETSMDTNTNYPINKFLESTYLGSPQLNAAALSIATKSVEIPKSSFKVYGITKPAQSYNKQTLVPEYNFGTLSTPKIMSIESIAPSLEATKLDQSMKLDTSLRTSQFNDFSALTNVNSKIDINSMTGTDLASIQAQDMARVTIPTLLSTTTLSPLSISPVFWSPPLSPPGLGQGGGGYRRRGRFVPKRSISPLANWEIFFKRDFGYYGAPANVRRRVDITTPTLGDRSDVGNFEAKLKYLL